MRVLWRAWLGSVVLLGLCVSGQASAQDEVLEGVAPDGQIAVISLDESASSDALTNNVIGSLTRKGYRVSGEQEIKDELERRRVKPPNDETMAKFAGLQETVGAGIKSYFYQGHKEAIEKLAPVFNLGVQNLDYLSTRPDLAQLVYESGTVLLRAYEDSKDKENAQAQASLLARHFPSALPTSETAPPEIIQRVARAKQALEQEQTSLTLQPINASRDCQVYLNGLPAGRSTFMVATKTRYFVRLDCGRSEPYVWRLEVREGQDMRVPIIDRDPFSIALTDASFESRDRVEQALRFISHWAKLPTLVGVSKTVAGEAGDAVLLVRVEQGRSAIWSDGADEDAVNKILPRILPELRGEDLNLGGSSARGGAQASGGGGFGRALPWILTGLGVAGLGAGGYFLWSANEEAIKLSCSNPTVDPDPSSCAGVDRYPGLSEQQFLDRSGDVSSQRLLGGVSLGVGAALVGVGLWWALSGDDEDGATLNLQLAPDRALVQASWRF